MLVTNECLEANDEHLELHALLLSCEREDLNTFFKDSDGAELLNFLRELALLQHADVEEPVCQIESQHELTYYDPQYFDSLFSKLLVHECR